MSDPFGRLEVKAYQWLAVPLFFGGALMLLRGALAPSLFGLGMLLMGVAALRNDMTDISDGFVERFKADRIVVATMVAGVSLALVSVFLMLFG